MSIAIRWTWIAGTAVAMVHRQGDPLAHRVSATIVADDLVNCIYRGAAGQVTDHAACAMAEVVRLGGAGSRETKNCGRGKN